MSSITDVLRHNLYKSETKPKVTLDSASGSNQITLDSAENYELTAIAQQAISAIHQWIQSDDLDDGETAANRLLGLMVGIADSNKNGELDDDEQVVVISALEAAWDYLDSLGIDEADLSSLFNDWDDVVASRVLEYLQSTTIDDSDIDKFVFGDDSQDAVFDATYAKRTVVRHGKKVRVNKRIAGEVHLTSRQKLAVRKMQLKARSSKAMAGRLKSMRVRKNLNL